MEYLAGEADVAVIGAGHAGIEAALAAARLGARTLLFTLSLDALANMPCNPSIGGPGKSQLVREIDALGGEMAKAADAAMIHSRMLNRGKGPAVHSLRVQEDRRAYHAYMKKVVERQDGLELRQAEISEIRIHDGKVAGVVTVLGAVYHVKAAIIATGTYLTGRVFIGEYHEESGPDGQHPSRALSESLRRLGVNLRRFKTGTPARVDQKSIDYTKLTPQPGEDPPLPFSYETERPLKNQVLCYTGSTNGRTHEVIRENLHRSPLYGGKIEGIGPRYCPSIEDKVVRFPDRDRHPFFIEPMGLDTCETYLQGLSSSLPEEVQTALYRTLDGFEQVRLMRTAYAIEYDCINPLDLKPTLEFRELRGLYGAGQFNGTSGYEEAAAQGLIAGINAVRAVRGQEPYIPERSSCYIGTLIDDLVTKGCEDPYRMMTARSEYRLLLRQDNADFRLTPKGYELGLVSPERFERFQRKAALRDAEISRIRKRVLPPSPELNEWIVSRGTISISTGVPFAELLRRPEIHYRDLAAWDPQAPELPDSVAEAVEIEVKYEGYIQRQMRQVEELKNLESRKLPENLDYSKITGLRLEAAEKLQRVRPGNIGQAGRISGVSPADLSCLIIYLDVAGRKEENA